MTDEELLEELRVRLSRRAAAQDLQYSASPLQAQNLQYSLADQASLHQNNYQNNPYQPAAPPQSPRLKIAILNGPAHPTARDFARHLAKRGHEVFLGEYAPSQDGENYHVFALQPSLRDTYNQIPKPAVAWSWEDPLLLRGLPADVMRLLHTEDFQVGRLQRDDWQSYTDAVTVPSASYAEFLRNSAAVRTKIASVPAAVNWPRPTTIDKLPYSVLYASPPDRGLHHLLAIWPRLRRRVPEATLRIAGDVAGWLSNFEYQMATIAPPEMRELIVRADLIRAGLDQPGVTQVGETSREQMLELLASAKVLAYPCNTLRFAESSGRIVLEACASACLPVVNDADCLGELFRDTCPMVSGPLDGVSLQAFEDVVVKALVDEDWRRSRALQCYRFAHERNWDRSIGSFLQLVEPSVSVSPVGPSNG